MSLVSTQARYREPGQKFRISQHLSCTGDAWIAPVARDKAERWCGTAPHSHLSTTPDCPPTAPRGHATETVAATDAEYRVEVRCVLALLGNIPPAHRHHPSHLQEGAYAPRRRENPGRRRIKRTVKGTGRNKVQQHLAKRGHLNRRRRSEKGPRKGQSAPQQAGTTRKGMPFHNCQQAIYPKSVLGNRGTVSKEIRLQLRLAVRAGAAQLRPKQTHQSWTGRSTTGRVAQEQADAYNAELAIFPAFFESFDHPAKQFTSGIEHSFANQFATSFLDFWRQSLSILPLVTAPTYSTVAAGCSPLQAPGATPLQQTADLRLQG
ncbi:hypothetical protein Purlil1_12084 [Purpureocillium lilacinum]|uniref:Uncharacterized protein n=1 Tax=Purpureocillium lilacinum TaxID=33203 RepID=A0ABR0BHT4_PURLI|nr:hypothetical protein Purlil1_12084 [Purpureocillium lilacinum]